MSDYNGVMEKQHRGDYEGMSERDREIQASIWSLLFLTSEMALAFRVLRTKLQERGALRLEDNTEIDQLSSNAAHLQNAYEHIERAFRTKYDRVYTAMVAPAEVTKLVEQKYEATKRNLLTL